MRNIYCQGSQNEYDAFTSTKARVYPFWSVSTCRAIDIATQLTLYRLLCVKGAPSDTVVTSLAGAVTLPPNEWL